MVIKCASVLLDLKQVFKVYKPAQLIPPQGRKTAACSGFHSSK